MTAILFDTPIQQKRVTNYITAYKYPNGIIVIDGIKYACYSMTEAIKHFKKNHLNK